MVKKYCNICGKTFNEYDERENYAIHKMVGYGSKYDGQFVHLNICIECMDRLIESCKIKPVKNL